MTVISTYAVANHHQPVQVISDGMQYWLEHGGERKGEVNYDTLSVAQAQGRKLADIIGRTMPRRTLREYSNQWASVERMSDGTFDLYNNVTGLFIRTVSTWDEAQGHLSDKRAHYAAIERKFA